MSLYRQACKLAELRCDIVDPRRLMAGQRGHRAALYLSAVERAPRLAVLWSHVMTWHLDKVDRAALAAQLDHVRDARRRVAWERANGRHHLPDVDRADSPPDR